MTPTAERTTTMHPTTITTNAQSAAAIRSAQLTAAALAALNAQGPDFETASADLRQEILALLNDPDEARQFAMVEYLAYDLAATTREIHGRDAAQHILREGYLIALNAHRDDGGQFTGVTDLLRLSHRETAE